MICKTLKRIQANLKVFGCIVTTFVTSMIYNRCRSACFLAKKTDRTCHVRLPGKMSDSALLMGGSCPHVRFFRMAGIQYTRFWAGILIFTICQRLLSQLDLRAFGFRPVRAGLGWLAGPVAHTSLDVGTPGAIGPWGGSQPIYRLRRWLTNGQKSLRVLPGETASCGTAMPSRRNFLVKKTDVRFGI